MTVDPTSLSALLQSVVFIEQRYCRASKRYGMPSSPRTASWRHVPDSYGQLGAQGELGNFNRELKPFVPHTGLFEGLVRCLNWYSPWLRIGP